MIYLKKIAFSLLFISFVSASNSQNIWPLKKCIETALENNLSIKNSKIALASTEVDKKQALAARYPDLSASSNVYWNFGRTIDPTSNTFTTNTFFRNGFTLNSGVALFNGFNISNTIKQTDVLGKAVTEDLKQSSNDIALNVATYYLNGLFAKENLTIAKANLELTKTSANTTQMLVKSGAKAENELLDVDAQLAQDEQAVLTAQNNHIIALLQLKQLMRIDEDIDVIMPDNIDINSNPDIITAEEVYNAALGNQASIRASQLRVASADIGVKIAEGQRYPTIGFGGSLGTNYSNQGVKFVGNETIRTNQKVYLNNQEVTFGIDQQIPKIEKANYFYQFDKNTSYGLGFNISVPILNNYRTTASIEKAKLSRDRDILNLETTKQNLKITVERAHTDAKAAKSKLVSSEKVLKAQEAAFNNASKKHSLGSITSFDLSNARTRLDNARNNYLIAKYDNIFKMKVLDFYLGKGISL
jgi:outer membrane protein